MTIDSQTCRAAAAGGDCAAEKCLAANDNHDFVRVCVCLSVCVCVSEMLFARFQFPQSFHQGKRPRKRPRYACPDSRYDTIYIHIRYIAMHNMFFVIVFLCVYCAGETLRGDANCFRRLIKIFQASYKLKTRLQLQHGLLPQMLLLLFMQRCTNSAKCKLTFYVVATPATKSRQISNSSSSGSPVEAGK